MTFGLYHFFVGKCGNLLENVDLFVRKSWNSLGNVRLFVGKREDICEKENRFRYIEDFLAFGGWISIYRTLLSISA